MAEAAIKRSIPSGYDEDFVDPPDEDLHCIICQLPSKGPVLTRCGHRFCRECLEEYLRRQEEEGCQLTCPTDREVLERNKDIFPDKLIERKILSLLIKCPSEGCVLNVELRAKEDHLASCIFKDVTCSNENCEVKVVRKDLTEHVTTKCQWRIAKCVYCGEHHPQCRMENHLETCEGFVIACPNKCETIIARKMIPNHVENDCPLTIVPCPYTWIGCNSEIRREELESHLQCETRHHLELACCKLSSLEEKVTYIQRQHQTKVSNLQNQLEERVKDHENQLKERVKVLENQLEEKVKVFEHQLEEKVNIQTEINERLNQNNKLCFAVVFVIVAVLLGLAIHVNVVKSHSEMKIEKVEKSFEERVNNVQSMLELAVDDLQKKTDSLLNTGLEKAEKSFKEQVNNVQSKLELAVDDLQKKTDSLLNAGLEKVEKSFEEQANNDQTRDQSKLELTVDDLQKKTDSLLNAGLEKAEKSFKEQMNNVQRKLELAVDDLQKKTYSLLNTGLEKAEKSFEEQVKNVQSKLELTVDDLQKKMDSLLNTGLGDNTFTWKIKSFEYVLTQAKSESKIVIESEPFYLYGYKLKLQLWPNGFIEGENTHLSLYLIVMKGEYDAILAWPFQKNTKFTLIDQQENPAERKNFILGFDPNPTHIERFRKPIINENIGHGYDTFVSHTRIRTRRFVVDDVIFIQIQLGPS